jgi:hypothetical protein
MMVIMVGIAAKSTIISGKRAEERGVSDAEA